MALYATGEHAAERYLRPLTRSGSIGVSVFYGGAFTGSASHSPTRARKPRSVRSPRVPEQPKQGRGLILFDDGAKIFVALRYTQEGLLLIRSRAIIPGVLSKGETETLEGTALNGASCQEGKLLAVLQLWFTPFEESLEIGTALSPL